MSVQQTPIAIRHSTGSEWMKHTAGRALADRRAELARAQGEEAWRLAQAFIPCG